MSLSRQFTKCDGYGKVAAKLNFDGEDIIKTMPGALITIAINIFQLYVII